MTAIRQPPPRAVRQPLPGGSLRIAPGLGEAAAAAIRSLAAGEGPAGSPAGGDAALRGNNRAASLRAADLPELGPCVLKTFRPTPGKGLLRRLEKAFQLLFLPRSHRCLDHSLRLRAAGVAVPEPLASWTDWRGGLRNVFLYRRAPGAALGDRWMGAMPFPVESPEPVAPDELREIWRATGLLVRGLFEAGFLHRDLQPKNLVVSGGATVALVDADAVVRAPSRAWGRRARFTAMAKTLRHVAECFPDDADPALGAFVGALCRGDAAAERAVRRALVHWRLHTGRSRLLSTVSAFFRCPPPPRSGGAPHPWDAAPRRVPSYDLVFSLGYDCNASLALRRAGLQFASFPFDWLKRAPLGPRADLLARRFAGWPGAEGLDDLGAAPFDRFMRRHRVVLDRATGLEMRHDFPLEETVAEALPAVAEKYARRAARLLDRIGRADRVLAVFCVGFRFPSLPMSDLVAARETLAAAFGGKIDVLGVADDSPGGPPRAPRLETAAGGHVVRADVHCLSGTAQGIEVNDRLVAEFLRSFATVPDTRTAAGKRAYRELERRRLREKYAASTWLGMVRNRMLFRRHRALTKKLQKLGLLPPNEPGAPRS